MDVRMYVCMYVCTYVMYVGGCVCVCVCIMCMCVCVCTQEEALGGALGTIWT